jgi:hypothetical protein
MTPKKCPDYYETLNNYSKDLPRVLVSGKPSVFIFSLRAGLFWIVIERGINQG